MATPTRPQSPPKSKTHHVRTFFASIIGIIGIYLILSSVTVIWLNQTLTNTTVYVNTVAPLVKKPAIQNFIAQKVTNLVISNAPTQNLAQALLPASDLAANPSVNQLKSLLNPIVQSDVLQIVRSSSFAQLWRSTNQTAHAQLVSQLNNNSNQLQLNLNPAVEGVINELKESQLSSVATKLNISSTAGDLDIKSNIVSKLHHYYKLFQEGTIAIILVALIAIIGSILLSVHHAKTIRRILFGVGILALLQALLLEAPSFIKASGSNQVTQAAASAFIIALFHNLLLASLIIGLVSLTASIGSKVYSKVRH